MKPEIVLTCPFCGLTPEIKERKGGNRRVSLSMLFEADVRRWLRHDWLVERIDYKDGDCHITWGFAYIEAASFKFGYQWFRNDGLPIRHIAFGWLAVGWGKTHEWFCCDSAYRTS